MTDFSPLSMLQHSGPCRLPWCEDAAVPPLLFHQVLMFSPLAGQGESMFPGGSQGSPPSAPHILDELLLSQGTGGDSG